jgi:hypothetical protein
MTKPKKKTVTVCPHPTAEWQAGEGYDEFLVCLACGDDLEKRTKPAGRDGEG